MKEEPVTAAVEVVVQEEVLEKGESVAEEVEDVVGVVVKILEEGESMAEKRVLEKAEDVVGVVGEVEKALMVTVMEGDSEGGKGAKGGGGKESREEVVVEGEKGGWCWIRKVGGRRKFCKR